MTACVDKRLVPEPVLIRKIKSSCIDLGHYGLGDRMMGALSSAMLAPAGLPCLLTLNIRDNRITPGGMVEFARWGEAGVGWNGAGRGGSCDLQGLQS